MTIQIYTSNEKHFTFHISQAMVPLASDYGMEVTTLDATITTGNPEIREDSSRTKRNTKKWYYKELDRGERLSLPR